jgi:hypothetical protein
MNDAELEKNLRKLLTPAQPTAGLEARIREELAAADVPIAAQRDVVATTSSPPGLFYRLLHDFGWACAGAAAVLVILAVWHNRPMIPGKKLATAPPALNTAPEATPLERDETTHELVSTENSDELIETDEGPAREVHYSYVERHAWSNPQTGARVVLEVPREDVYLVPVSLQ